MDDNELMVTVDPEGGLISLILDIPREVSGDWTVNLSGYAARRRRWEGTNRDNLPDVVRVAPAVLNGEDATLNWSVILYAPAQEVSYRIEVRLEQDERSLLPEPIVYEGELQARKPKVLSGTITLYPRQGEVEAP